MLVKKLESLTKYLPLAGKNNKIVVQWHPVTQTEGLMADEEKTDQDLGATDTGIKANVAALLTYTLGFSSGVWKWP